MKNSIKKVILEATGYEPNNLDKYPIKTIVSKSGNKDTFEFGLKDNLLVYRNKTTSGGWKQFDNNQDTIVKLKKDLYNIDRGQSINDTPGNSGTKQKCVALTTPPTGLTLNITNPNDKNYIYGKVGEEWFAQNVKNKKIFNLTKCNYTTSIANLEKLNPSTAKSSVEDLKNQSVSIQKSMGLPETGSFDVASLEKLITFLSDEARPKVQSLNSLVQSEIQPSKAGASITQVAPPQTITK